MTREQLDEIERLARAATPGPWKASEWYGTDDGGWAAVGPHHEYDEDEDGGDGDAPDSAPHERAKRDSAYIAALSPDVALALVSRIRELEAEVARLREAQDRHLALIAELSKTAPYEGEAKELRGQIAALVAEVGTLRAKERVR